MFNKIKKLYAHRRKLYAHRKKKLLSTILAQATTVRKNWLRSFYAYLIYFVVGVVIDISYFSADDTIHGTAPLIFFGFIAFQCFLLLWGPYYFGYKNRGTLFLFLTYADLIYNLIRHGIQLFETDWSNNIDMNDAFILISLGMTCYYATTCYNLYVLNSGLNNEDFMSPWDDDWDILP